MSFLTPPQRIDTEELLDEANAPEEEMRRSLRDLRRFNSVWGGNRAYRSLVNRLVPDHGASLTILDLGTGASNAIAALSSRKVRAIGLDFNIRHLLYGRELDGPSIRRVSGDATRLPFPDNSVDVVTSVHFFHHFSPQENAAILQESLRVARRGVIANDTRRHYFPLVFVRLLGLLRLVGPITRFDGPASVLRGYTADEAGDVGALVKAARTEVVTLFPFRFGLLLWK